MRGEKSFRCQMDKSRRRSRFGVVILLLEEYLSRPYFFASVTHMRNANKNYYYLRSQMHKSVVDPRGSEPPNACIVKRVRPPASRVH